MMELPAQGQVPLAPGFGLRGCAVGVAARGRWATCRRPSAARAAADRSRPRHSKVVEAS